MILKEIVITLIICISKEFLNNNINNDLLIVKTTKEKLFNKNFKLKTLSTLLAIFIEDKIEQFFIKKNIRKIQRIYKEETKIFLEIVKISIIYLLKCIILKFLNNENIVFTNKNIQNLILLIYGDLIINIVIKLFQNLKGITNILDDILSLFFHDFIVDLTLEVDLKKQIFIQIINFFILKFIKKLY